MTPFWAILEAPKNRKEQINRKTPTNTTCRLLIWKASPHTPPRSTKECASTFVSGPGSLLNVLGPRLRTYWGPCFAKDGPQAQILTFREYREDLERHSLTNDLHFGRFNDLTQIQHPRPYPEPKKQVFRGARGPFLPKNAKKTNISTKIGSETSRKKQICNTQTK